MFIFYWGMVSYITPPVALGAYAAAAIAESSPMRTGFEAMRFGSIIYFIPFFFVLDPAFILRAPWLDIVLVTASALAGVTLLAAALQGYLVGVGDLTARPLLGWPVRGLILAGGLFLATPENALIPLSKLEMTMAALATAGPASLLILWLDRRRRVELAE